MAKIRLKNSVVANRAPNAAALDIGELAINASNASPALYFRDDSNVVHKIAPGASADSGGTTDRPSSGNQVGDLFFDTDLGVLLVWNGSSWEPIDTGVATVDLGYTPALDKGTVTNTAGTSAEIPVVGANAGLMAPGDKTKLDGVTAGAEPNVKPNWNAAAGTDAEILNKPDIPEKTSDLINDGEDGTSDFVTFADIGGLGGGTVTSVGSGDGLTGGPVTTVGALSVQADGDTIAVSAAGIKVADGKFAEPGDLPTNTSDLTNDGEDGVNAFITANELPTKTSELTNDGADGVNPFITANDIPAPPAVPDKTSDLTNDGENGSDPFITANELPTKTSELTNDGENGADPFITANDLPAPPDLSGYLELEGGNLTGGVTQTERAVGAAAGGFDLSEGNFWSCGLADVPAPTNGVNGQSGLIRFTGVVNSWDAAFKNTPTSVEPGDIIPFYVEGPASIALGTKNLTGSVAGFWTRDGATSTLSPANAGDGVEIGAVTALSLGYVSSHRTDVPCFLDACFSYPGLNPSLNTGLFLGLETPSASYSPTIRLHNTGAAGFAGDVKIGGALDGAGSNTSAPNISLNANGSAQFESRIGCKSISDADAAFQVRRTYGSQGVVSSLLGDGTFTLANASSVTSISLKGSDGSANFAGSITAQNVTFGLTPEQQTTYGIQELDIKERILNFITRIEQLEARVAELEGN